MTRKGLLIVLILGLAVVGCEYSTNQAEDTSEVVYSGPDASEIRFGDKGVIVTPCTVGGNPLTTFFLGSESVEILNQYVQGGEVILLTRWSQGDECRWVKFLPVNGGGAIGYRAEILAGTNLLYGLEITNDADNLNWTKFEEFTNYDSLWLKVEEISETKLEESFSYNNQEVAVVDRDPDPYQYNVADLINQATAGKSLTIDDLLGVGSSLYESQDGQRLVQLLELPAFGQWLYNQYNSGDLELAEKRWTVSDWFNACATIKCLAGGFGNPVCATCAVVSGGLLFTKAIICSVDCDAWPEGL